MRILRAIDGFFFSPRSATSFGLMRVVWAAAMLWRYLMKAPDVARLYSDTGVFPRWIEPAILREQFRYSVLDLSGHPLFAYAVYCAFLACLVLMLFGVKARLATVASVLLLFSFDERNSLMHSGGDTLLRLIGFLLMISPGITAFSADRLKEQWTAWKKKGRLLPPLTMPAWPKRLLLWQTLVLYLNSFWSKMVGDMWRWGTVVGAMLNHPHYSTVMGTRAGDLLSSLSKPLTWGAMAFEGAWGLLLVPRQVLGRIPLLRRGGLRRMLLFGGVFFHLCIHLTMYVGYFFPAMLTLFIGLIEQEDIDWLRRRLNGKKKWRVAVLYDGHCGFCTRSVFTLAVLDHLKRLRHIDYHDEKKRGTVAPDLRFEDLDRAMHIRLSDGRTFKAFRAFRVIALHLPLLWPAVPFLYLPGAAWIGEKVYARVARKRVTCSHGNCAL